MLVICKCREGDQHGETLDENLHKSTTSCLDLYLLESCFHNIATSTDI